jgi:DNA invertase Pin-like site-specific DNA recombinase
MSLIELLDGNKPFAIYMRISTNKQDNAMQEESIRDLLQKFNLKINPDLIFEDIAVSASLHMSKRPALQSLLKSAAKNKFKVIIIYKIDRLARNIREHKKIKKELKKLGVSLITSEDGKVITDQVVSVTVSEALTQLEHDNIKQRTKDTIKSKRSLGQWGGGGIPFGYKYIPKKDRKDTDKEFTRDEVRIKIVESIYDDYKLGHDFENIATKRRLEDKENQYGWNANKIKAIITNPIYAGYLSTNRYSGRKLNKFKDWELTKHNGIEPIFKSLEEWKSIYFNYEVGNKTDPKRLKTPFLLKDIIYCYQCNIPFQTKNQETKSRGKSYGNRIYYCSECKIKISASELHSQFESDILRSLKIIDDEEKVISKLEKNFSQEIKHLTEEETRYKKNLKESEKIISTVKIRIQKSINNQQVSNEKYLSLKSMLYFYLLMDNERKFYENKILEIQEEICRKKKIKKEIAYKNLFEVRLNEANTYQTRLFILNLFSRIYLTNDNKLHLELKNDLN